MALTVSTQAYSPEANAQTLPRWTAEKANAWYGQQRWLVGSNFIPIDAINQFEMWQAGTFNPTEIDRELGYAQGLGMNTMRVFLHNKLYEQDPEGFKTRIDTFLGIAAKHGIRPIFVLFDSCWDPNPALGTQHPPIPGTHNSGWVQSPGTDGLMDESQTPKFKAYVEGIVGRFAKDERILAWDVWNEPDNQGGGNYRQLDEPVKIKAVARLLPQVFDWARGQGPVQPLTSGLWHNDDWSPNGHLNAVETIQLAQSDIISFHNYDWPEILEARIRSLQPYGRPLLLTEYMARGNGSTFDSALPMGRKYNVAMINWGFVVGKTQTNMPWDSWQRPYTTTQPTLWFHDIFQPDGTPYRKAETDQIKRMTAEAEAAFKAHKTQGQ
ncbi:cellulase family glycosylhydrolase [Asticcacaulis solisilvae]|uniref:cellulase family glycosylhydrolase n=1 Tax=Asticcacaulis solisilvae TaxID=1217274 RepID=UPI003FD73FAE